VLWIVQTDGMADFMRQRGSSWQLIDHAGLIR